MSQDDLSFERLLSIARWLGVSIDELLLLSRQGKKEILEFSSEHDEFLAGSPLAIYLFLLILYGKNIEHVGPDIGVDQARIKSTLVKLEKIGLIQFSANGRPRVASSGPFKWKKNGRMAQRYLRSLTEEIFSFFIKKYEFQANYDSRETFAQPFDMHLTKETTAEFIADTKRILMKYRRKMNLETASERVEKLFPVTGLFMVGEFDAWRSLVQRLEKAVE